MLQAAVLAAVAAVACGQWIGMTPSYAASPPQVQLFLLNSDGSKSSSIGDVAITDTERVSVDAFRCKPYGTFCVFTTVDLVPGNTSTWLYVVSASDATVQSRTLLLHKQAYNLHIDATDDSVYTVLMDTAQPSYVVARVRSSGAARRDGGLVPWCAVLHPLPTLGCGLLAQVLNGTVTPVLDITEEVGSGTIHPGGSTQCSESSG
jgi:hypothetical protein